MLEDANHFSRIVQNVHTIDPLTKDYISYSRELKSSNNLDTGNIIKDNTPGRRKINSGSIAKIKFLMYFMRKIIQLYTVIHH